MAAVTGVCGGGLEWASSGSHRCEGGGGAGVAAVTIGVGAGLAGHAVASGKGY